MATRVLVIDDDPEYRQILQDLGSSQGWDVQTCDNGRDGLEQARKAPPQLIVTDLVLGDTDGFALCEQFRQDPRLKAVPIIMVTGTYRREEDRLRGQNMGADAYLVKPFSLAEFLQTAAGLLKA